MEFVVGFACEVIRGSQADAVLVNVKALPSPGARARDNKRLDAEAGKAVAELSPNIGFLRPSGEGTLEDETCAPAGRDRRPTEEPDRDEQFGLGRERVDARVRLIEEHLSAKGAPAEERVFLGRTLFDDGLVGRY